MVHVYLWMPTEVVAGIIAIRNSSALPMELRLSCTNLSISSIILADHLILLGTFITIRLDIDQTLNSSNDIFRDELCGILTMSVSYAVSIVSIWEKPTMLQRKDMVLPH